MGNRGRFLPWPRGRRGVAVVLSAAMAVGVGSGLTAHAPEALAVVPACGAAGAPSVTALHNPEFAILTASGYDATYFGYRVTAPASAGIANLWVSLSNFTGGVVGLAPSQPGSLPSGAVAASGSAYTYFLAKASGTTATAQTHTVTVYDGNPSVAGATALCTQTSTITSVLAAASNNSNKVSSITMNAPSSSLGSTATVTVVGQTGNLGATDPLTFVPTANSTFPAGAWRLTDTSIALNGTYPHVLTLTPGAASGTGWSYTATYTFTAVGTSASAAAVTPVQYVKSRDYVVTGSVPTVPNLPAVTSTLSTSKTRDVASVGVTAGGDVRYTVTVANSGSSAVSIDDVTDLLPIGTSYKSGSAQINGSSVANPDIGVSNGQTSLVFIGPYSIPATGNRTFSYVLTYPPGMTPGVAVNAAVARVGSTVIGTSGTTTPAQASVTVVAPPTVRAASATTPASTPVSITPSLTGTGIQTSLTCLRLTASDACVKPNSVISGVGTWSVNSGTGVATFSPVVGYSGITTVLYEVTDAVGQTARAAYTVSVAPIPIVTPVSASTTVKTAKTVTVPVNYDGGGTATLTSACVVDPVTGVCSSTVTVANVGTWSVGGASYKDVTFTPATDYSGTTVITYVATVSGPSSGSGLIQMTVASPPAPTVLPASASTSADTPVTLTPTVTGTDIDPSLACVIDPADSVCRSVVSVNGVGTWTVNTSTGAVEFRPITTYSGTTTITYRAEDAYGQTGTGTLTVTVTAVPAQAPTISVQPANQTVVVGGSTSMSVTASVTDGGTLSYQWYLNGVLISGATSATYSIASATTANAGTYTVVVTNTLSSGATASTTSNAATLTVLLAVTYNANSATSGTVPPQGSGASGSTYTVAANSGSLARTGYTFAGWNTQADGLGTNYPAGTGTFTLTTSITLYAQWSANTYTITYNANSASGGTVPSSGSYTTGGTAYSVASNTGSLVRTGYTFAGWNTQSDGLGTTYAVGASYSTSADLTLYARWTANTYTISYNANSATGGTVPSSGSYTTGGTAYSVASNTGSLVRTGYTFAGWNTQSDGLGTTYAVGASYSTSADLTLYAKWTANTYTISYNANSATSGSVPTSGSYTTGGLAYTVSTNSGSLARTGYTFAGWNTQADGLGTTYAVGASYSTSADLTLYAKWTANTYTITYNANSATGGTVPSSGSYTTGGTAYVVADNTGLLVKTGYTFAGWNTAAGGGGTAYAAGSPYASSADVTLYAQWSANTYAITYNANGATSGSVPTSGSYTTGGSAYSVSDNTGALVKTGYSFAGWNTQANGLGTTYAVGAPYSTSADLTLYARWTANTYAITYNANGATSGSVPSPGSYTTGGSVYSVSDNTGVLAKTGYSFAGWNTAANGSGTSYAVGASYSTSADATLYAQWSANTYAITYSANGATSGAVPSPGSYTTGGSAYSVSDNTGVLAKTGYSFSGWNTQADGLGTAYAVGASYSTSADLTLYARWTANTYTITYNANGATSGSVPTSGSYTTGGSAYSVASNTGGLAKTGYSFAGWNTQPDGLGTSFAEGSDYSTSADVTMYAQWSANTYTISYAANTATSGAVPADGSYTSAGTAYVIADNTGGLAKTGYTFDGWNTAANGSGTSYAVGSGYATSADVTLYAQWGAVTYDITYDGNGATSGSAPAGGTYTTGGPGYVVSDNTGGLAKTGYDFAGWNTAADGGGTSYTAGAPYSATADATLYAQWSPVTYAITYDANGATGGSAPTAGAYTTGGAAYVVAGNTGFLARTGYAFAGWNTSAAGTGTGYAAGATYSTSADLTLYARWSPITYSITYNGNGATTGSAPASGSYTTGGAAYTIAGNTGALTKTGYAFAGWNTAANGSGTAYAPTSTYSTSASVTLYAQWSAVTYDITYDGNGATGGTAPTGGTYTTGGPAYTVAGNTGGLARTGYTFAGWNTAADGSGSAIAPDDLYSTPAAVTLFAQWSPITYTITYAGNGATGGSVPAAGSYTTGDPGYLVADNTGGLVRTGYWFSGWNTAANGSGTAYVAGEGYATLANVTLYAQWSLNPSYSVAYNGNGETTGSAPAPGTFTPPATYTIVDEGTLAKSGYHFTGWNTVSNGSGTAYPVGATYGTSSNLTLFAQWEVDPSYSVTYDANGATSGTVPGTGTFTPPATYTIAGAGSLVRAGYTFDGWNTAAAGSGTAYAEGATYAASADLTLYAQWTLIPVYTVSYDANGASSGSAPASDTFTPPATVTISSNSGDLRRTGFNFIGWNTQSNGKGTAYPVGVEYGTAANLTLYADWEPGPPAPSYTITYDGNGSTGGSAPAADTFTPPDTTTIADEGSLVKSGSHFTGWNTAADGSGAAYAAGATYSSASDLALYAQWAVDPSYSVSYDGNGSTGGSAPAGGSFTPPAAYTVVGNTGSLVKDGWTWSGWNSAADGSGDAYAAGSSYGTAADLTLFATWTEDPPPPVYTVTYDGNGSTGGTAPAAAPFSPPGSVTIAGADSLTRSGFSFDVWTTSADGSGTPYAPGSTYGAEHDLALFAQWTPDPTFTVTYDGNGATSGSVPAAGTVTPPATYTIVGNTGGLALADHSFAGWNTAADGSGTAYAVGASYDSAADLTLFAVWTVNPPTPTPTPEPAPGPSPEPAPSPTPEPSVGPAPLDPVILDSTVSVLPGQDTVLLDGAPAPVTVQPNGTQTGLDVTASDWGVSVGALLPDGKPAPLAAGSVLEVLRGEQLVVRGTGFEPGTTVRVYILEPGLDLGWITVGPDGFFTGTVLVPATLARGGVVLQVNGYSPAMLVRSVSLGMIVRVNAEAKQERLGAVVRFAPLSARLTPAARATLRRLAAHVPAAATDVTVQSVGFVQPTANDANDQRLSTARARAVAGELRRLGVDGRYYVTGRGPARSAGSGGRRVDVTIVFSGP